MYSSTKLSTHEACNPCYFKNDRAEYQIEPRALDKMPDSTL